MIREKARELLTLLKQGSGSATIFGSSYYDDEMQKIIEVITNECKSTVEGEDGTSKRYESDINIKRIREIVQQLMSSNNFIKNSLINNTLGNIPRRKIPGIMKPVKVYKKVNEEGIPYLEVDKLFPDNLTGILRGEINREELLKTIIKPYIARICKNDNRLSKKHFFSRIFNPFNRKQITDKELITRFEKYLRENTDIEEEKIQNTSVYFVRYLLGNSTIIQDIVDDELHGTSIEDLSKKTKPGYSGMLQNMSENLFNILNTLPNPNDGLNELEDIYANLVGQLVGMSTEPAKDAVVIEEQIKNINMNINRKRQQYYGDTGYKNVDLGLSGKDVGFTRVQHVEQAMKLYSESIMALLEHSKEMSEEQYIKEVAKLHFRFIQIHPFPDGNGRTARAITNMLLLEKEMVAAFPKISKDEYNKQMAALRAGIVDKNYIKDLYTDQSICNELEEEKAYKLEEYIGMKCLGKYDLYADRNITTELLPEIEEPEKE